MAKIELSSRQIKPSPFVKAILFIKRSMFIPFKFKVKLVMVDVDATVNSVLFAFVNFYICH